MPAGAPTGVVLLTIEDDPEDTVVLRLIAAAADLTRIAVKPMGKNAKGRARPLTVSDLDALAEVIDHIGAKLVVIDPLVAYLGTKVDSHQDKSVREVLGPLQEFASEIGVAIVGIRHPNKNAGGNALNRGGGSNAIIGGARSGMLLARDPDDDEPYVLAMTKHNLAVRAPSVGLSIREHESGSTCIKWTGVVDQRADELFGDRPINFDNVSAALRADRYLREVLADGPVRATAIDEGRNHRASSSEHSMR
jgi:RecA-family ATPase